MKADDTSPIRELLARVVSAVIRRAAFYRRTVVQSPIIKPLSDARYEARLAKYAGNSPTLSDAQASVLAELRDVGVSVRALDFPADVLASADGFVDLLRHKQTSEPCLKATPRELGEDPRLFLWGLSPHLLELAESHVGLPVRYLGVEVKRELVADASSGRHEMVRRWHLDHEDRRVFKVIVYLSDVNDQSGPFGYLPRCHTERIGQLSRRRYDAVSDESMQSVVPPDEWKRVTGPRLTSIHVDTGQVFHRVFPPTTSERFSVTFAYSSRSPYYTYSRLMLPRRVLRELRDHLTPRQWDALRAKRTP